MSYASWFGTPAPVVADNELKTSITISSITNTNTTVNVVPQVILFGVSTATLNTGNPSEIISYTLPATGFYSTQYNGFAFHAGGCNWSNMSQLDWFVKVNNAVQSNTVTLVQPQYICGDSASQFISILGGGIFYGTQGDVLEWTTDGNASPAITTGFNSGFSWISLQKIG